MKSTNKMLNNSNGKVYIILAVLLGAFFVLLMILFTSETIFINDNQNSVSKTQHEQIEKNLQPIDVQSIIDSNNNNIFQQEVLVEEVDMEYNTKYKENNELAKGVIQVLQEGRVGKKNVTIKKLYQNGELVSEEIISEGIIKAPVERVVEIGTGNMYNYYTVSENDDVYVVANSVSVRLAPDENSEKICTLNKNAQAKALKIEGDWCFISTIEIKGYVPLNCITTKNPNAPEEDRSNQYTRQQLLANLSADMDLRKPSGFSIEQFKQVLSNDPNDKNKIFEENAEYFFYAEKQYNINGVFIAAIGVHESAWGTSSIARNKKNLFGYGAVDSNPYGGAYSFETYGEGIDLLARVLVKYYINPPGTKIYDGTTVEGKFYSGSTISAVNKRYASDKNWANSVYKWMQYLYGKL